MSIIAYALFFGVCAFIVLAGFPIIVKKVYKAYKQYKSKKNYVKLERNYRRV